MDNKKNGKKRRRNEPPYVRAVMAVLMGSAQTPATSQNVLESWRRNGATATAAKLQKEFALP
ncbi:MAG: hypothetical protein ABSF35_16915 [Polyangia bacterium]